MDRLDLVNLMSVSLFAMARSVLAWYKMLEDPEVLSSLNDEELMELASHVSSLAREFVKYDIRTSKRYSKKGHKSEELKSFEDLYEGIEEAMLEGYEEEEEL